MKVILDLGDGIDKELNKLIGKPINPLVAEAKVIHIVNAHLDKLKIFNNLEKAGEVMLYFNVGIDGSDVKVGMRLTEDNPCGDLMVKLGPNLGL